MEVITRNEDYAQVASGIGGDKAAKGGSSKGGASNGTKTTSSSLGSLTGDGGKQKRKAPPAPPSGALGVGKGISASVGGVNLKSNGFNQSGWSNSSSSTTSSSYSPSVNSFSSSSSLSEGGLATAGRQGSELTIKAASSSSHGLSHGPGNFSSSTACVNGLRSGSELKTLSKAQSSGAVAQNGSLVSLEPLSTSGSNPLSPSPSKSDEGVEQPPPPRLLSIESSSNLHQDAGLTVAPDAPTSSSSGVKLDYVSLDFVRSQAAEGRSSSRRRLDSNGSGKEEEEEDRRNRGSNSSLSSSLLSSVDSEDGSTIGSDVVENLYNKITAAAAARHSSFTKGSAPEIRTGDIERDLFPQIFPGYRRRVDEQQKAEDSRFDLIRAPVDLSANRNSNNNKSAEAAAPGSRDFPVGPGDVETCPECSGVVEPEGEQESMNDALVKARELFGRCMCNSASEVFDPIEEIDYCNSNLKEVPPEVWAHAPSLTRLLMESNTITELPRELFACQNLRFLSVSDNDIAGLPPFLANLVHLQHLDVSKNVIEDVPECIKSCKNLQVLDASVNPVERLGEGFTQLISLRELYMNDCFFEFLPASFGRLTQLVVLELRDNQLQILPKSMRRLTQLSRLDLGGNVFQDWPEVIGELRSLTELWLDCNELGKVPPDLGALTKLTYLDLSRNYLEAVPGQIGQLVLLRDLLLSENSLTSVPDSIGFLKDLTILNLESNQLSSVPDSLGRLRSLEELDLSHNKLDFLPKTIGNLRSLQTLLLDENNLSALPSEIGSCESLKILQISRNEISELPQNVGNLLDLRVLNISQNRLPHLPISMIKLARLNALWITPNQSKPNVPLHAEVEPGSGKRVLTNILFPQKDDGASRSSKLLSILDDDDDGYANDAADDDDPVRYAQRPRGQTHVVFNMEATTYSNTFLALAGEGSDFESEEEIEAEEEKSIQVPVQAPEVKPKPSVDDFSVVVSDTLKQHTGLSVLATPNAGPGAGHYEKPTLKIANILRVPSAEDAARLRESAGNQRPEAGGNLSADEEPSEAGAPSGIRAWTSHSHLPAITTPSPAAAATGDFTRSEQDLLEAVGGDSSQTSADSERRGSSSYSNATSLLDRLELLANRSRDPKKTAAATATATETKPAVVRGAKESHAPPQNTSVATSADRAAPKTPVEAESSIPAFDSIPFMDDVEVKAAKENQAAKSKDDDIMTSPKDDAAFEFAPTEGKSSSVTSGESLPATDHDSGVGNDVESQESIADAQDDVIVTKAPPKPSYEVKSDSTALRRNKGGWIALVRTDQPQQADQESDKRANQLHFAPNVSVDSTTVTYSFDYKNSKQQQLEPQKAANSKNKNNVSENIKKFEKFFEGGVPGPRRASEDMTSSATAPPQQPQVARKPPTAAKPKVLPPPPAPQIRSDEQIKPTGVRFAEPEPPLVYDVTRTSRDDGKTEEEEEEQRTLEQFSSLRRPTAQRKSKFEEALAATKHKHFRDKLEKMMQQKTPLTPGRRSSRGSTSSLASIPRITSPVPMALSPHGKSTPLDRLTAENAFGGGSEDSSSGKGDARPQQSVHERLKEKLQPAVRGKDLVDHPAASSRPRPSSANSKPFGKRGSNIRSSIRSVGAPEAAESEEQEEKKTLEQQLGNLLLDGTTSPGLRPNQGFKPYKSDERRRSSEVQEASASRMQSPPPISRAMSAFPPDARRGAMPSDWKDQLLRHIERKKQEKYEITTIHQQHPPQATSHYPQQQRAMSPSYRHHEPGSGSSSSSQPQSDPRLDPRSFPRNSEARRSFSSNAKAPPAQGASSSSRTMPRSITAPPEVLLNQQKRASLTREQSAGFVRAAAASGDTRQPASRRSSGRFLRTRTPGPEPTSGKTVDSVVRPKSAMDLPTGGSGNDDFFFNHGRRTSEEPPIPPMQKPRAMPGAAPPSYAAHMRRNVTGMTSSSTSSVPAPRAHKHDYSDYVNVEMVDQMRAAAASRNLVDQNNGRNNGKNNGNNGRKKERRGEPTQPSVTKLEYAQPDAQGNYPLRGSGSHESVLNSKTDKAYPYESALPVNSKAMRGSNSQDSIVERGYQPHQPHHYPHRGNPQPVSRAPYPYEPIDYVHPPKAPQHSGGKRPGQYGFIPAPSKTRPPKIPPRDHPSHGSRGAYPRGEDYARVPERRYRREDPGYFLPPPTAFHDEYADQVPPPLSPSLQRNYNEREDESVASAFRPYHHPKQQHQQQQINPRHSHAPAAPGHHNPYHPHHQAPMQPHHYERGFPAHHNQPRSNVIDHHRHHHHLDRGGAGLGNPPAAPGGVFRYPDVSPPHGNIPHYPPANPAAPRYHNQGRDSHHDEDQSAGSEQSLSGELSRHWREADAAAELVTVTVMKNPTFGFHIMGGTDAGGNPYRPDDDGVFITYVAPGGAADGQVMPGDKILLVNGSDFVGITHKRAVDLLRNAGQVAVLVVERLVGRPV